MQLRTEARLSPSHEWRTQSFPALSFPLFSVPILSTGHSDGPGLLGAFRGSWLSLELDTGNQQLDVLGDWLRSLASWRRSSS